MVDVNFTAVTCRVARVVTDAVYSILRTIVVVAKSVFAFTANIYNNIKDGLYHKLVYSYQAPQLPKGCNWVQMKPGFGNPIIYVHGRGALYSDSLPLFNCMADMGLNRPMYAVQVQNNTKLGIEDCAAQVSTAIEQILSESDDKEISLIGHSYGGLQVAEIALQGKFSVDQITTIGSPMQGTDAADCLLAPSIVQNNLGRHCEKIQDLNEKLKEASFKINHVISNWDFMVFPQEVMCSKATHKCYWYTGSHGHAGLVDDENIAQWIYDLHKVKKTSISTIIFDIGALAMATFLFFSLTD